MIKKDKLTEKYINDNIILGKKKRDIVGNARNKMKTPEQMNDFVDEYLRNGMDHIGAYITTFGVKPRTAEIVSVGFLHRPEVKLLLKQKLTPEVYVSFVGTEKEEIIVSNLLIREKAIDDKDYGSALRTNELICKLKGYFNENPDPQNNLTFNFGPGLEELNNPVIDLMNKD